MTKEKIYLNTIYFYLTDGCNLNCRHCWINPKFKQDPSKVSFIEPELFRSIIKQGKELGISSVKLTGGEPLMHPKIKELLDIVKDEDLRLNMETNGLLLTKDICKKLAGFKKKFISVSIDSFRPEIHDNIRGVKGSLNKSIQGIKNLLEHDIHVQIIMTIMKENYQDIEGLVKLAEELKANSVKFNIVQPTERGVNMHDSHQALSIKEYIDIGRDIEDRIQKDSKIKLIYSFTPAFKSLEAVSKKDLGRCGIKGIIGVLGNGKYALCGIGESVKELVFGDARTDKLKDIIKDNPVLKKIRADLPKKLKGVCGRCMLSHMCLGSCIAQNYYRHKDLFAPYWFCEEAEKQGLFPKTRLKPEE